MRGGIGQGSWRAAARGSFPETTPSSSGGCRFLLPHACGAEEVPLPISGAKDLQVWRSAGVSHGCRPAAQGAGLDLPDRHVGLQDGPKRHGLCPEVRGGARS